MYSHSTPMQSFDTPKIPQTNLFCVGDTSLFQYPIITIVGPRKPTAYAIYVTKKVIGSLVNARIVLCSGLAVGIDAIVHEEALRHNVPTIAFPGSSLEQKYLYPKSNHRLAERIVENGGLLSSPWETQPATTWTFPQRNKLLARVADFVLIVQAGVHSGTLLTARAAQEYTTPLGVVPGPIDSELCTGSNALLQEGALCILSGEDILHKLNIPQETPLAHTHPLIASITGPMTVEELAFHAGYPPEGIASMITQLEIEGVISIDCFGIIRKL